MLILLLPQSCGVGVGRSPSPLPAAAALRAARPAGPGRLHLPAARGDQEIGGMQHPHGNPRSKMDEYMMIIFFVEYYFLSLVPPLKLINHIAVLKNFHISKIIISYSYLIRVSHVLLLRFFTIYLPTVMQYSALKVVGPPADDIMFSQPSF